MHKEEYEGRFNSLTNAYRQMTKLQNNINKLSDEVIKNFRDTDGEHIKDSTRYFINPIPSNHKIKAMVKEVPKKTLEELKDEIPDFENYGVISSPLRLEILKIISSGKVEPTAYTIAKKLKIKDSNASYHLQKLAEGGLLGQKTESDRIKKRFKTTYYITDNGEKIILNWSISVTNLAISILKDFETLYGDEDKAALKQITESCQELIPTSWSASQRRKLTRDETQDNEKLKLRTRNQYHAEREVTELIKLVDIILRGTLPSKADIKEAVHYSHYQYLPFGVTYRDDKIRSLRHFKNSSIKLTFNNKEDCDKVAEVLFDEVVV